MIKMWLLGDRNFDPFGPFFCWPFGIIFILYMLWIREDIAPRVMDTIGKRWIYIYV